MAVVIYCVVHKLPPSLCREPHLPSAALLPFKSTMIYIIISFSSFFVFLTNIYCTSVKYYIYNVPPCRFTPSPVVTKLSLQTNNNFFVLSLCIRLISGGAFAHSLSWHRKGEHIAGCKLYARVWMPEDPLTHQKGFATGLSYATEHTRLWSLSPKLFMPFSTDSKISG